MKTIRKHLSAFARNEDGAVTVDWVALTAGIVFLGMAAGFTVSSSVPHIADNISSTMSAMTVMAN